MKTNIKLSIQQHTIYTLTKWKITYLLIGLIILPTALPAITPIPLDKPEEIAIDHFKQTGKAIFQSQKYYRSINWGVFSQLEFESIENRRELRRAFNAMHENSKSIIPLLDELDQLPIMGHLKLIFRNIVTENILMSEAAEKYIKAYEESKVIDYKQFGLVTDHDRKYGKWLKKLTTELQKNLNEPENEKPMHSALAGIIPPERREKVPSGDEISSLFSSHPLPQADTKTAFEIFRKGEEEQQAFQIMEMEVHPENFVPLTFFRMANVLNYQGKKEKALFWFLFGELRSTFNANLCDDPRPLEWVANESNRSCYQIKEYAKANPKELERALNEVLDLDKEKKHCYNPLWPSQIYDPAPKIKPKNQWVDIWEQTRKEFKENFKKSLELLNED